MKKKILFKELLTKHPADIAEILAQLNDEQAAETLHKLAAYKAAAAPLGEMEPEESAEMLDELSHDEAIAILRQMDPDDAVDLLAALPVDAQRSFLAQMDVKEAKVLIDLLAYPPDTAGGLMSPEVVALPLNMTAAEAIDQLRRQSEEVETIYYAYVVDDKHSLQGVLALRDLALSPPMTHLAELLLKDVITISVDTDVEEVGLIFDKYNYIALPVVNDTGKLLGIITVDDVIDVIREEVTEDIYHMAGIAATKEDPLLRRSILTVARLRLPWLVICLVGGLAAAGIIGMFEEAIAAVVVLVAFIPVIMDMGGNIGTQSSTIIIRGLATGSIDIKDGWKLLWRELRIGLFMGAICGIAVGVPAQIWKGEPYLGIVVGVAMVATIVVAATLGAILPILFQRFGVDPAVASGPAITTVKDITGLLIYFGVATWIMGL